MNQGISKQSLLLKSSAIFQKPRLNEANFKLNLKIKIPNFKKAIKTSFPFIFQEYLKLGIILHAFSFHCTNINCQGKSVRAKFFIQDTECL